MAELLQTHTTLEVMQVNEKVNIKPDCVYVIPPNKTLVVGDNHLELEELHKKDHKPEVIDLFFRSLGEIKAGKSVCIVLSGAGSDGAVGLKAVKENGGLVIAQEPYEAEYSGMPNSAIQTGCVDKILPVGEMAEELMAYKKNLEKVRISDGLSEDKQEVIYKILAQVKTKNNHDFTHYKRSTVLRRIERRMHVNHADTLAGYLAFVKKNPDEAGELCKDLLISVTNFFRDPKAFEALENDVIPKLFENKKGDDELRVWVPGCATGEEAYSIAMLMHEYAGAGDYPPEIKIFATDVDEEALHAARKGRYAESIATDVSEERLQRYFSKTRHGYQIKKEIRGMILFSKHNLLGSPPFSKQDMISCRNLLIYLNRKLQGEVFNLFHYALNQEGFLFLGSSDSNLEATELFRPFDNKYKIYRQSTKAQSKVHLSDSPLAFDGNQFLASHSWKLPTKSKTSFEELHRKLISRQYGPPSVIINENYDVLHAGGDIDSYLKYTRGEPSRNILEMVIPTLRPPLRSLLFQAKKDGYTFPFSKKLKVNLGNGSQMIEVNLHKVEEKEYPNDLMYVVFRDAGESITTAATESAINTENISGRETEIIEELERELKHTKEQLQTSAEDYEASNEELRASNEELMSINEEMQSTTEELETSQEELQSINEELKTVNQELESKMDDLYQSNSDLKNLMDASEIGIIFVDDEHRVKRFTNKATEIFNLTHSDEGRPLEHFTHRLKYDTILDDITAVLEQGDKLKKEVTDKNNHYFIMRLVPYVTTEDKAEGVVITFVEVTELKDAEVKLSEQIEEIKELQREILNSDIKERWKIGQYLHDELAQSLLAAGFIIDQLARDLKAEDDDHSEEIQELKGILKRCTESARDISHEIVPIDIEQEGVVHAFASLGKQMEKNYGLNCVVEGDAVMQDIDVIEVASSLYRIAHEAAKNAALHGGAKNISIKITTDHDNLCMDIEDDGAGFTGSDPENDGRGISIMRHRMDLIEGTFKINRKPGKGKTGMHVSCKVPIGKMAE